MDNINYDQSRHSKDFYYDSNEDHFFSSTEIDAAKLNAEKEKEANCPKALWEAQVIDVAKIRSILPQVFLADQEWDPLYDSNKEHFFRDSQIIKPETKPQEKINNVVKTALASTEEFISEEEIEDAKRKHDILMLSNELDRVLSSGKKPVGRVAGLTLEDLSKGGGFDINQFRPRAKTPKTESSNPKTPNVKALHDLKALGRTRDLKGLGKAKTT